LALFGDRMPLPLDKSLCEQVTGRANVLVHPCVVANIAIGQSTAPTQRVKANLFYSDFLHRQPVWKGDTLRTRTEVIALRRNRPREGKDATGLAVLRITTFNQHDEIVLSFMRCPMLPCRDDHCHGDSSDDIDTFRAEPTAAELLSACPKDWDLSLLRERCDGPVAESLSPGQVFSVESFDTVLDATLLVRATLNMAQVHTDSTSSHIGERLVYGGHTISMASAQVSRALPGIATIVGWQACNHIGPVMEGDRLSTQVEVVGVAPLTSGGGLCDLRAETFSSGSRQTGEERSKVLDWRYSVLMC